MKVKELHSNTEPTLFQGFSRPSQKASAADTLELSTLTRSLTLQLSVEAKATALVAKRRPPTGLKNLAMTMTKAVRVRRAEK